MEVCRAKRFCYRADSANVVKRRPTTYDYGPKVKSATSRVGDIQLGDNSGQLGDNFGQIGDIC